MGAAFRTISRTVFSVYGYFDDGQILNEDISVSFLIGVFAPFHVAKTEIFIK